MDAEKTKSPVSAFLTVESYLASILPPNTPPCYRSITSARFVGSGRKRVASAELEMFDSQPATIEVFQWEHGQGHRWSKLPGGDAYYAQGRWQRESDEVVGGEFQAVCGAA